MLEFLACNIGGLDFAIEANLLLPKITNLVVDLIKIAVPIILVIFGMLDLAKAVMSNDEKEMKGAQTKLIKRVIYAVVVFLVVSVVQLLFGVLANTGATGEGSNISSCISCFVSGTDNCAK